MSATKIVPVNSVLMPVNNMLRPFEQGKQEKDATGKPIEGKGDKAYQVYYERKLSMEKELAQSGFANHTPIIVYEGHAGRAVEIAEGLVDTVGKYVIVDGMQRAGTAYQMGPDTPVQVQIVPESRAREIMISSGYHRKANSPAQFTKILRADLQTETDLSVEILAKRYSMSEATIRRFLDILTLPVAVSDKIGTDIPLHTGVALADKIKRLASGDTEIVKLLTDAALTSRDELERVAGEISIKQKSKKLAEKNITPVYKELEPIYNAERAKIIKAEIDNMLEELPDSEFFKGQLQLWEYIHGVSATDKKADKEKWDAQHATPKN